MTKIESRFVFRLYHLYPSIDPTGVISEYTVISELLVSILVSILLKEECSPNTKVVFMFLSVMTTVAATEPYEGGGGGIALPPLHGSMVKLCYYT